MTSEKALYWIGVSVLALFVSNHVALRHLDGARCLLRRSMSEIEQPSAHASRVLAAAQMMLGGGESRFDHAQLAVDQLQTRLASSQCALARHQAAFARVQAEHARMEAMQELRSTVVCPRQSLRIVIPERPATSEHGAI